MSGQFHEQMRRQAEQARQQQERERRTREENERRLDQARRDQLAQTRREEDRRVQDHNARFQERLHEGVRRQLNESDRLRTQRQRVRLRHTSPVPSFQEPRRHANSTLADTRSSPGNGVQLTDGMVSQAEALLRSGWAMRGAGRERASEIAFRQVLAGPARHADAHYGLGYLSRDRGDFHAAQQAFSRVLEIEPTNANALYELGSIAEEHGSLEDAQELYADAIRLNPDHKSAKSRLEAMTLRRPSSGQAPIAARQPDAQRGPLTDLQIPDSVEALENYRLWKLEKERADFMINNWHAIPWPLRAVQILMGSLVLGFFVFILALFVTQVT